MMPQTLSFDFHTWCNGGRTYPIEGLGQTIFKIAIRVQRLAINVFISWKNTKFPLVHIHVYQQQLITTLAQRFRNNGRTWSSYSVIQWSLASLKTVGHNARHGNQDWGEKVDYIIFIKVATFTLTLCLSILMPSLGLTYSRFKIYKCINVSRSS